MSRRTMMAVWMTVFMCVMVTSGVTGRSAVLSPTPEPCCVPHDFEGKFVVDVGQVGVGGEVITLHGDADIHSDSKNERLAIIERIENVGQWSEMNFITTGNITYMINPRLKMCFKFPGSHLTSVTNCIPHTARYMGTETLGGMGDQGLKVNVWHYKYDFLGMYFNVTNRVTIDSCLPVTAVMTGGRKDGVKQMQTVNYSDFKKGIVNPDVFDLPEYCKKEKAEVPENESNKLHVHRARRSVFF